MAKKRPKSPPTQPSSKQSRVELRMEDGEKNAFAAAAKLSGLSLSAWIRLRLRSAARNELEANGDTVTF